MPENLTTLDGILKDFYTSYITDQTAVFDPIHDMFVKQTDSEWSGDGRQAIEAVILSYNEGVGALSEDANLPTAGNFNPQQFKIPMRYVYGTFKMTKQMMKAAESSKGAFKNAMRVSMDTLVKNIKRERARMIWGYGAGLLCRVSGAHVAQTTILVDDPGGVAGAVGGARFLRPGMTLVISNDGVALTAIVTVLTVASTGLSFTVSPAISVGDDAQIFRVSTLTSTSMSDSGNAHEPMGLLGMVDDGTYVGTNYFNLSRTTYPQLKSTVKASVGALTLDVLQQNFDVASQLGDANISTLAGHYAVRRAYLALLEADRRYTGSDLMTPDGGTKVVKRGQYVTFGNVPFVESRNAPYGSLFGLDKTEFKRYVQIDGEWADESGAILRQSSTAGGMQDTWTAFYRIWENYICSRPNQNFRLDGITTTTVYVASY